MPTLLKRQGSIPVEFASNKRSRKSSRASSQQVQRAVRAQIMRTAETKYYDAAVVRATLTSTGYVSCVNQVAGGTDYNNRVGRHLTPKYVMVDYYVEGPQTVNTGYQDTWYFAVVWDRQPDGTAATFATIYDVQLSTLYGMPFKAVSTYKDRFKILHEERGTTQNTDNNQSTQIVMGNFTDNCRGKIYVKLPGLKTEWGQSGAAVPTTGGLYVVFGSNNMALSTDGTKNCMITYNCRFAFTDM